MNNRTLLLAALAAVIAVLALIVSDNNSNLSINGNLTNPNPTKVESTP